MPGSSSGANRPSSIRSIFTGLCCTESPMPWDPNQIQLLEGAAMTTTKSPIRRSNAIKLRYTYRLPLMVWRVTSFPLTRYTPRRTAISCTQIDSKKWRLQRRFDKSQHFSIESESFYSPVHYSTPVTLTALPHSAVQGAMTDLLHHVSHVRTQRRAGFLHQQIDQVVHVPWAKYSRPSEVIFPN